MKLGVRQLEAMTIAHEKGYVVCGKGGDCDWSVADALARKGLLKKSGRYTKLITDAGRKLMDETSDAYTATLAEEKAKRIAQRQPLTIQDLPAQLFQRYWSDTNAKVEHPSEHVWEVTTRREAKRFTKDGNVWIMTTIK